MDCCKECIIKAKLADSSCSDEEPTSEKSKKSSTKRYKKKDGAQTNVNTVYILDNDDYEGDQVGDNHFNKYVEASDDDDDDDIVPRAKSARLRTITSKSKRR